MSNECEQCRAYYYGSDPPCNTCGDSPDNPDNSTPIGSYNPEEHELMGGCRRCEELYLPGDPPCDDCPIKGKNNAKA